jgi:hypothetical protein
MLRSVKDLRGYTIRALDGDIGEVNDFYFDDRGWIMRYLVVDTANWLSDRQVLITPEALGQPDWESQIFPVDLNQKQVSESPPVEADQPVSRSLERELHHYFGWRPYWSVAATPVGVQTMKEAESDTEHQWTDPHLRSAQEVIGYHIQALDGEIGHIDDLIADDDDWHIRYLVIDTRIWLFGKQVLVSPAWADTISWVERKIRMDIPRETIKNSPDYNPSAPVNRAYEVQLYDYYGRPKYW